MNLKELFITHKLASILICATVGVTAVGGAGYGIYAANKNNEAVPSTNEVVEAEVSTETEEVPTVQEANKNTEDVTTSTSSEKKEEVKKEETAVKSDEKKTEETTKKQEATKEEKKTSDTAKTDTSKKETTTKKQETSSNSQTSSTTSSNKTSTDTKKSETKKDSTASTSNSSTKQNDSKKTYHTEVEHHDAVYETVEWQEWVPPVTHTETRTIEFDNEIYNTETLNINGVEYPPGTYVTGYEHVVAGTYEEPVEDVPGHFETKTEQQKVEKAYDAYYTVCDQTGSRTLDNIVYLD